MNDQPSYPPLDYLKFLFACDSEQWQTEHQAAWMYVKSLATKWGAKDAYAKLTVLGGGKTVGSRYIVEFSGPVADYIAVNVPLGWYRRLRRVDFRSELRGLSAEAIRAAQAYYSLKPKGEYNATGFDTPSRTKSTGRDVGGVGMFLGSRKSDIVGAVYRRGREAAAFELRVQNDLARHLTERIWRDVNPQSVVEFFNNFYQLTQPHEQKLLKGSIDVEAPAQITSSFDLISRHMPKGPLLPTVRQMALKESATMNNIALAEQIAEDARQWVTDETGQ